MFELTCSRKQVAITINGVLHLLFRRDWLVGVQAWQDSQAPVPYSVEYTFSSGSSILTEYDIEEKWREILGLLRDAGLFG